MADEKFKDEAEEEESKETQKKPSSKSKLALPIIILIAIIGIGALGGGGFYLYSTMKPANAEEAVDAEGTEDEGSVEETNLFFDGFESGIVNLAVSSGYSFNYLKYGFDVEVESEEVLEEVEAKLPRLSAKVAGVMSNRDWNEISSSQGRERLARDAMSEINDELKSGEVIGLYFTTFVAQ